MRFFLAPPLFCLLALAAIGCGGSDASARPSFVLTIETPPVASSQTPDVAPPSSLPAVATATPQNALPAPTPAPSVEPSPTTAPPTSTFTPPAGSGPQTGPILLKPAQMVQGGTAIVYLTEPAASATARFGGLQYPMLQDGARWWAVLGIGALATPGSASISVAYTPPGSSESRTASSTITIIRRDFPVERIDLSPSTSALLAPEIVSAEINQRASIYGGYTTQRLWSGPFVRPSSAAVGDIYGVGRSYNGAPVVDYHRGLDFVAQEGDPLVAAASGRVAFAGALRVRGNSVIIDHGAGVFTAYHHLSRLDVSQGQTVAAGQQVGLAGSTGLVTGPHLHWEVLVRGIEVDGELWLRGQEIGP